MLINSIIKYRTLNWLRIADISDSIFFLAVLLMVIFALLFHKYIVRGLTEGSLEF